MGFYRILSTTLKEVKRASVGGGTGSTIIKDVHIQYRLEKEQAFIEHGPGNEL